MKLRNKSEGFELDKPIGEPEVAKKWRKDSYFVSRLESSSGAITWVGEKMNWMKLPDNPWHCLKEENGYWEECDIPIYEKLYQKMNKNGE